MQATLFDSLAIFHHSVLARVVSVLVLGMILSVGSLQAQQPTHSSLYFMNRASFNPACVGLEEHMIVTGTFRAQYTDLVGAPNTQLLQLHTPVDLLRGGLGISLENDIIGARRRSAALLQYSYHLAGDSNILSLGIGAGIRQIRLNGRQLRTPDGVYTDVIIDHNDPFLTTAATSALLPLTQAGLYYKANVWQLGVGVRNVLESTADLGSLSIKSRRNYYGNAEVNLHVGSSLMLQPMVYVRSDLTETQLDMTLLAHYNNNIFGGASLRGYSSQNRDALAVIFGLHLNDRLTAAYAYDMTLSSLQNVSSGSHEISLRYDLGPSLFRGQPPRVIYHPRQL